jgi:two-component system response regulator AtoC
MAKILIIDDEYSILESLEMFLVEKGHSVFKAATGEEGHCLFCKRSPDVVILDIRLPDLSGLQILDRIKSEHTSARVIMMTAFHDMETTIQAMKQGAYDYIHKPLDAHEVERSLNRALHILEIDRETPLIEEAGKAPKAGVIIGKSKRMQEIFKMIGLLCQNRATVLIQGETGTGKELIARVIHRNSLYSEEPFVTVDCGALVETLLESELFGHESGAFTGAIRTKKGKIELAGMGTLFLDEVGELPLSIQGKFLGFLQRREYMRVGGQDSLQSRCRIMAATNRDLPALIKKGSFREDLYFRLKVVTIQVPPLRERISDIPDLVNHFVQKINLEMGTQVMKLEPGVMERLMVHSWNGNVRELENVLVEALVKASGRVLLLEDLQDILSRSHAKDESEMSSYALPLMEKEHIQVTLEQLKWNRTKAAKILGISLPTLRSKIRKYSIQPPA